MQQEEVASSDYDIPCAFHADTICQRFTGKTEFLPLALQLGFLVPEVHGLASQKMCSH